MSGGVPRANCVTITQNILCPDGQLKSYVSAIETHLESMGFAGRDG